MSDDDWFSKAADEAAAKATPRRSYGPGPVVHVEAPPKSAAEVKEAAAIFEAVASGLAPAVGSGPSGVRTPFPSASPPMGSRARSSYERQIDDLQQANDLLTKKLKSRFPDFTPEQGLAAIVKAVKVSPDPFVAAGEWITRITQGITQAVRDAEDNE